MKSLKKCEKKIFETFFSRLFASIPPISNDEKMHYYYSIVTQLSLLSSISTSFL